MTTVPTKLYMKNHPYKRPQCQRKHKKDKKTKLVLAITSGIGHSLKGNMHVGYWGNVISYGLKDLIKHLKLTMPKGYTWRDYRWGKLHVDHIIPIRAFVFDSPEDEEFKQCWSLYNLRLLPAKENIIKKDKITNPILLGLLMTYNQNKEGDRKDDHKDW